MKIKYDIFPKVTEDYVLAGNQQHLGGFWFRGELLHIIKCAKNTLALYDEENITDDYIKELDSKAIEEEMNEWKKLKKHPRKV